MKIVPSSPTPRSPESGTPVIVGIDLGTTNSLIGVLRDGKPVLLPNAKGTSSLRAP
jgi:molecular chaperone DnaK (HSP70)